ncbi:MAG: hypothetical protein LBM98_11140 [Oscillospiraceae bacterium]|jgi:hypothetical protein|nr:hypothetical protein [Oscillospiraceae bacterium]
MRKILTCTIFIISIALVMSSCWDDTTENSTSVGTPPSEVEVHDDVGYSSSLVDDSEAEYGGFIDEYGNRHDNDESDGGNDGYYDSSGVYHDYQEMWDEVKGDYEQDRDGNTHPKGEDYYYNEDGEIVDYEDDENWYQHDWEDFN